MSEDDVVLFAVADGLATITLNRPARLNALTGGLLAALRARLEEAADDRIRCILIAGAGRGFCAGQDLNERDPDKIAWPPDLEAAQKNLFHPIVTSIRTLAKPVVVAVGGVAAGAGASLALAGDIVVAGRSARFIQSFAKIGLSVDAGGGWQLARLLGPARAKGLLLTGGALSGEEAERLGLIWRCVPDDALADTVGELARGFAAGPTTAYAAIKAAMAATDGSFESYLAVEAAVQGVAGRSADYREGVSAFLAKRAPTFSGT